MELRRRRKRDVRIDLSALIDALFLLLIFFAVSTTFRDQSGIKLELPRAETATPREPQELTVLIGADGDIRFQDQPVDLESLEQRIRDALATADEQFVVLQADKGTPLGTVVDVMDRARKAGAQGVTIASKNK